MSSLLDRGLMRTAVAEQVVAPFACHLCHLVLLCDSEEDPEHFDKLEETARSVAKATSNMAAVASRQVSDTDDDVLRKEMVCLLEPITVSGQHVLLAAQKLSIQPGLTAHKDELITAAQTVFLGVVKVLLVHDNSMVREVLAAAAQVSEHLSELASCSDIRSLLNVFLVFSDALLLLSRLTAERADSLKDPRQAKELRDSLETLRMCIPMMHTATCTTIKHPTSKEAQAAKSYVLDKTHEDAAESKMSARIKHGSTRTAKDVVSGSNEASSLTSGSFFLKQETASWDPTDNKIVQETRKMADTLYNMTQYLRNRGPLLNKEAFVCAAKDVMSNCQSVTNFIQVIANHCLDAQCALELSLIVEQILTITNQLSILSSVSSVTLGCKASDEILVKNTQNLLHTVLKGVHAVETACITGLKQPEPNSDGAEATTLCFQWKRNLEIHRAQQTSNPKTDELGLRKISLHSVAPSLASPV
ncbi:catenin alpha isoform X3 [Phyllopteryx taeniolatus]|uniref:catenin alpha isoform X3 n=1 Tax=Phyllopteryx taeniolatus TaxID=161469 RepID=UPI002AD49336|nr:catenin alpha isoform X3 [Phyllopteryx taeniolatus]